VESDRGQLNQAATPVPQANIGGSASLLRRQILYPDPITGRWATFADDAMIYKIYALPFLSTFSQE
jgi:hypothetical protein